jgi:ribonuclease PH
MTGSGRFVEVQGTAEREPFDRAMLDELLDLAATGCARLTTQLVGALTAPITHPVPPPAR